MTISAFIFLNLWSYGHCGYLDEFYGDPRIYIQTQNYTVNLFPIIIPLAAFTLGLLLKDVLTSEMEDYVSGSAGYYTSPGAGATQYIADTSSYSHSYGDPTRIFDNVNTIDDNTIHDEDFGNLKFYNSASNQNYVKSNDDYRVKPKNMNFIYYDPPSNYDRSNHKPSDFETAAAALDLTLNSIGDTIGDVGLSFLGTVVGLFSTQYDEPVYQEAAAERKPDFDIMTNYVQIPEEETRKKGDFLRSLSVTPSPTLAAPVPYYTTAGTTATPAYSANLMQYPQNYPSSTPATFYHVQSTTTTPPPPQPAPQMLFDPSSSTLYVDSHLANNLQLDDGTSVELPTDVLLNSINSGQVQVINSNSKMDVGESKAVQAQVIQPAIGLPSRHQSIRDLLHYKIKQRQEFRPNVREEEPSVGKVWSQINKPSYFYK